MNYGRILKKDGCTRVAEGLNLLFKYQFMFWPQVLVCTSESLRIFQIGEIILYMVQIVVLQCTLRCIYMLPVYGQSHSLPYGIACPTC